MGYYLGVAKFSGSREAVWLAGGYGLAALTHAAYDVLLFTRSLYGLLVVPLIVLLWRRAGRQVRDALALDDRRFGTPS